MRRQTILKAMKRLNELGVACLILLALAACSQKEEFKPTLPVAEIKGKPIVETAPTTTVVSTQLVAVVTHAANAAPAEINGYTKIGFDKLASFHYVMPDEI